MAKDQTLLLNPTKISGICGRLMCCLKYESDGYGSCCKKVAVPVVGREAVTVEGEGKIIAVNSAKRTATVQLADDKQLEIPWEEVVEKEGYGK